MTKQRVPSLPATAARLEDRLLENSTIYVDSGKRGKATGLAGSPFSKWCMTENHNWCTGVAQRFSRDLQRSVRVLCECRCHELPYGAGKVGSPFPESGP